MGPDKTATYYNVYINGGLVATFDYAYYAELFISAYLESKLTNFEEEEIVIQKSTTDTPRMANDIADKIYEQSKPYSGMDSLEKVVIE